MAFSALITTPYGKSLREFVSDLGQEKFLTTQHERDVETGLDYRGARFYEWENARYQERMTALTYDGDE